MGRKAQEVTEETAATYQPERADLECKSGSHNKEYHLQLVESESGWSVLGQYGAIGSTLRNCDKAQGVSYEKAKSIFDKTVREKVTSNPPYHYVNQPATESLTRGAIVEREVLFSPELLTRITEQEAAAFAKRERYGCQRKRDGNRLTAVFRDGDAFGLNKKGQTIQLDARLRKVIVAFCVAAKITRLMLDGESETAFFVWDLLEIYPLKPNVQDEPYRIRHELLTAFVGLLDTEGAQLIRLVSFETYASLLAQRDRIEGMCVKDLEAPYRPGRNGQHYKFKFEDSGAVIVGPKIKQDDHRSVAMYAMNGGGKLRYMGTVGVPDKYPLPKAGDLIEVRYLYLHRGPEGRLYQPKYFGKIRRDVSQADCNVSQFKLKQDA